MFNICEANNPQRPRLLMSEDTLAEACEWLLINYPIAHYEFDADNNAADAIDMRGNIYTITERR